MSYLLSLKRNDTGLNFVSTAGPAAQAASPVIIHFVSFAGIASTAGTLDALSMKVAVLLDRVTDPFGSSAKRGRQVARSVRSGSRIIPPGHLQFDWRIATIDSAFHTALSGVKSKRAG
jgi:hypothetical protein